MLRSLDQHLGIAEDAAEDIVEVVRDAAGEAADRLHLGALAQALFPLLQGALAPPQAPRGDGDQHRHGGRGEQGTQRDAHGLPAPGGENRIRGRAGEHFQRKAAHRDDRFEHQLVEDRAVQPAGEASVAVDRGGDGGVLEPVRACPAGIGHPGDDHAAARAQVDEAPGAQVDAAIETVKALGLHHRRDHAVERAARRVEAPRHHEAPFAFRPGLVRVAEEKAVGTRLAVHGEVRTRGEVGLQRGRLIGAADDAAASVDDKERGDLRQVDRLVAQPRHHACHACGAVLAHRIAQYQVHGFERGRRLLGEQAGEVGHVAPRRQVGSLPIGLHVPDRGGDVDADQHDPQADQRPRQRDAGCEPGDRGSDRARQRARR